MTFVRIKGFHIYIDRHGKQRCYHRATRTPIDLAKHPIGSAGFLGECARIGRLHDKAATSKPGTLGLLIKEYRQHDAFKRLSPRTRRDYDRCFAYLRSIDDTPLSAFTTPLVVRLRDRAGEKLGQKWGTYVKTTLSLLFSWGRERGYVDINPAERLKGLKKDKDAPEANRPWDDAEREAVLVAAPQALLGPLALMMFCGLDPGDVATLPRSCVTDTHINTRRGKTSQPVWMPLPTPARLILAGLPKHDGDRMFLAPDGGPWTYYGLYNFWRALKERLEAEGKVRQGLTMKGLRHTVAGILAEIGMDERTIADYLGQKTVEMARHYSRRADKRRKMGGVVLSLDEEVKRRAGEQKDG